MNDERKTDIQYNATQRVRKPGIHLIKESIFMYYKGN